jgi:hypothetical protein
MQKFEPNQPFVDDDFPSADRPFPIVEIFGYERSLSTQVARSSFARRWCPFADIECEKYRQYGYGNCSVTYRAEADSQYEIYATCDHRLDGAPIWTAVDHYFGAENRSQIVLIPEVVLTSPRQSFDFVALNLENNDFCAIEAQAIDLRGGGVGPAFNALLSGNPREWRQLYSDESDKKGRKDNVAYGVNTANIYKRLGLQIAEKGGLLSRWNARLYVIAQHRCFEYLERRAVINWNQKQSQEIVFLTFDYTGRIDINGQMEFAQVGTYCTTVSDYASALVKPSTDLSRGEFLTRVRKKAGLR